MELEQSPIYREVLSILSGQSSVDTKTYDAYIHTLDNNKTLKLTKVISMDVERDYMKNISDVIVLDVACLFGNYVDHILPYKNNLELTLVKRPLYYGTQGKANSIRYKAIINEKGDGRLKTNETRGMSTSTLNLTNIINFEIQLIPLSTYVLRNTQVRTIFRKTTVEQAIKTLLSDLAQRLPSYGDDIVKGIDMVPADNQEPIEQIPIPTGSYLSEVPRYIHEKVSGVYHHGICSYVQDNTWYIFPPYQYDRPSSGDRKLTVILIPKNKLPGITRTYKQINNHVTILATGDAINLNKDKIDQMNLGSGVYYQNAESFFDTTSVQNKGFKSDIQRDELNSGILENPQSDGKENITLSDNPITSNIFRERSKLSALKGGDLVFTWENANPDVLFPGMMVEIMTLGEKGKLLRGKGTLLACHHFTELAFKGIVDSTYRTTSLLQVKFDDSEFV